MQKVMKISAFLSGLATAVLFGVAILTIDPTVPTAIAQQDDSDPRKIVFTSNRTGDYELYTVNADGSNLRQLTFIPGDDRNPEWSPDYSQVAFTHFITNEDGEVARRLWVVNADGSNARQVSDLEHRGAAIRWSPDGTQLFLQAYIDEIPNLYIVDVESGEFIQVSEDGGETFFNRDWSPDGTQVIYHSNATGSFVINVFDVATLAITKPIPIDASHANPTWDANSDRIAFDSGGDIWVVNPDGTRLTQLTSGSAIADIPVWSPDGTQIAFRYAATADDANRRNVGIGVMNADGSNVRILVQPQTRSAIVVFEWSPDSTQLVFGRNVGRENDQAIFLLDIASGEVTNLTEAAAGYDHRAPDW